MFQIILEKHQKRKEQEDDPITYKSKENGYADRRE
jgi:hypothetical protein